MLTDLVLPRMSGRELAAKLVTIRPEARIAAMSGYPGGTATPAGPVPGGGFLSQPYTAESLGHFVRQALDREEPPPA